MPTVEMPIGDGELISSTEAGEMIDNFSTPNFFYELSNADLITFIEKIETEFPSEVIPVGNSLGLRFYVGKPSALDDFEIVAVPVVGPDRDSITGLRDHSLDLEETFFGNNHVDFFALRISTGNIIDLTTAAPLIAVKDTLVVDPDPSTKLATQLVYFSLAALKGFSDSLVEDTIKVYLSRIAAGDCLSIVLEGKNTAFVYFDKSDLVPPPPRSGSSLIDDTSF